MAFPQSSPFNRFILFLSVAGIALLSAVRVVEYGPVPWGWIVAFALGTAILVGPVTWVVRDQLPKERRKNLGYVAGGLALLCVPVILGLGLIFGNLLRFMDAGVLGGTVGLAIALLVERLVVPKQLRSITR